MKIALFETLPGFGGGNTYQKAIVKSLRPHHSVDFFSLEKHPILGTRWGKIWHAAQVFRSHPEVDLWIASFLPTCAQNFARPRGRVIHLFFHRDDRPYPYPITSWILGRLFLRQARKSSQVVTIAKYWRQYLQDFGVDRVDLIYWGFELEPFQRSQAEVNTFKSKYHLLDKPIIYLGNCQREKGVVEAYQALKHLDAFLVTSGEPQVNLPATNLRLSYPEYCTLLRAADVTLTLSHFEEGWNATAHEAMLARTPVVGSGLGGMAELLQDGGQLICNDLTKLEEAVRFALANQSALGERGYQFARQFTLDRFAQEWNQLVDRLHG